MSDYLTNLTDKQYSAIIGIICDKHKRNNSLREIFNAVTYLLKTGCQWRMLPQDFPKWELGYYYFNKWQCDGTIEEVHEVLRSELRMTMGKSPSPSVALIDSQSVKTTRKGGADRGVDGEKKIKGRKRHIITDTNGLLLAVKIHAANIHDSKAAVEVVSSMEIVLSE